MKQSVTIYGKERCPFTRAAIDAWREKGAEVTYIDVIEHPEMMSQMLAISKGERKIPLIITGDGVTTTGWQGKN